MPTPTLVTWKYQQKALGKIQGRIYIEYSQSVYNRIQSYTPDMSKHNPKPNSEMWGNIWGLRFSLQGCYILSRKYFFLIFYYESLWYPLQYWGFISPRATYNTDTEGGEYYYLQLSSGKKYLDQPCHFQGKLIVTKSKVDKILNFPFS